MSIQLSGSQRAARACPGTGVSWRVSCFWCPSNRPARLSGAYTLDGDIVEGVHKMIFIFIKLENDNSKRVPGPADPNPIPDPNPDPYPHPL